MSNRQMRGDLVVFAREAAAYGLRALQLREKDLSTRALLALALQIREVAPELQLFINDRPDVALACSAAGIQASEAGWPAHRLHQSFDLLCGKSMHSVGPMTDWSGVDFATFGPVFATPSKTELGIGPRGLGALRQTAELAPVPVFAIGGMTPERAARCRENGAQGVAVMSDLLLASDLRARLQEYESALGQL
ncbi:MAG: thiamine phosphate synthase [Bacteroidota bacterium]|nr:thiamine phosphate synthase [Bacteroidota bacterium]MDP4231824.1 thiamine phosphate synthase [Bacteroidota bacterium]MDP4242710.1 thiamine phosphate synthase [Bacteroidota bacterium]